MVNEILNLTTGSEDRVRDPLTGKMILLEYTPDESESRRRFFVGSRQTNPTRFSGGNQKHRVRLEKHFDPSYLR